jgi:S1-C subfamily serine protease
VISKSWCNGNMVSLTVCIMAIAAGYVAGQFNAPQLKQVATTDLPNWHGDQILTEHTVSKVAKSAGPWVVDLETDLEREVPQEGGEGRMAWPVGYHLRTGTGIIVRPDGYIVTSNHVITGVKKLFVTLSDERKFESKIVGRDPLTDIAVLKIDAHDLPCAEFADTKSVEPGDFAVAIGSPMRLESSVTLGVVSGVARSIRGIAARNLNLIQTDAAINPGSSGGPLLNIHGQVIGMNTAVSSRAQNIGFAVPADEVRRVTEAIIKNGAVERGYLALELRDNQKKTPYGPASDGVAVLAMMKDSLAGKAGVEAGDIIEAVNDMPIRDLLDLSRCLIDCSAGDTVNLKIQRKGQWKNISVPLQQPPPSVKANASD